MKQITQTAVDQLMVTTKASLAEQQCAKAKFEQCKDDPERLAFFNDLKLKRAKASMGVKPEEAETTDEPDKPETKDKDVKDKEAQPAKDKAVK